MSVASRFLRRSLSSSSTSSASLISRRFGSTRAAVCGAAGGIGQPLSMLLKLNPNIDSLSCIDVVPVVKGVAVDLSHINTPCQVTGGFTNDELEEGLSGCDIVVVPAGVPRKPGMTRDDLFNINASINSGLAEACARACPNACLLIISNPVNSMVPIWAETLKKLGVYDPRKLFGVTTLDVTRANTFVAGILGRDVTGMAVDVIGGHAGTTILPLLSQVSGLYDAVSSEDIAALTKRIQFGGDEVVKAKDGAGSATLSMAGAGAEFAGLVARALKGETGIRACSYVESSVVDGCQFFASPVVLGANGVESVEGFGTLSASEQSNFDEMVPDLKAQIQKGIDFVANK